MEYKVPCGVSTKSNDPANIFDINTCFYISVVDTMFVPFEPTLRDLCELASEW